MLANLFSIAEYLAAVWALALVFWVGIYLNGRILS